MFVVNFRSDKYGSSYIFRRIIEFDLGKSKRNSIFQKIYRYSTMSIRSISLGNESTYQTFYLQSYRGIDPSVLL